VTNRNLAVLLIALGIGIFSLGYVRSDPHVARRSNRPYAYISIMAVGAILIIGGGLLWRDR
jgi:NADH:ubiquinone oxidoreductase subunit 5 (subunit L)/multisubunit Na+/H+ antiporter MnhA subunit